MRQAIVSVRDEDGAALGVEGFVSLVRDAGLEDVELLSCEGTRGVVRVHVETEIDEGQLADLASVTWCERVSRSGSGSAYLVEFGAQDAPDVHDEDLVVTGTVDVDEHGFTFDLTGSQEAISDAIAGYRDAGVDVKLETLRDYEHHEQPLDALTARQREVLQVAYDEGYFDVPRRASTEVVAAALDLDTSTVSEHLQRAERNLLSTVLPRPA